MNDKLLKVKVTVEYEFVAHDKHAIENITEAGEQIFRLNYREIIAEALADDRVEYKVSVMKSLKELPDGWSDFCLPYTNVLYGDKDYPHDIGTFFKNETTTQLQEN